MDPVRRARAEDILGYRFSDERLLEQALTHASTSSSRQASNERMEFLGDAVLGVIVCEHLYRLFPSLLEGDLTKVKSLVVSRKVCAEVALQAGLVELLLVGKGLEDTRTLPVSVAAAVFESLIGAVYLDGGFEAARSLVLRLMAQRVEEVASLGHHENFKSILQQAAGQLGLGTPAYLVLDEKGPDHNKCFEVCVELGARRFEARWGTSKKQAEQSAALEALRTMGYVVAGADGRDRVTWGQQEGRAGEQRRD